MTNEDRWEERANRWADRFTNHPVLWSALAIIGVVLFIGVVGWAGGWINAAKEVVSPANVKEQYARVIEDYKAMEVAASNACGAEDSKGSRQGPTFLEDPAFAYKAQYRHITVDYNRRQNNIFEAGVVGPSGYPRNAPTLEEMQAEVC